MYDDSEQEVFLEEALVPIHDNGKRTTNEVSSQDHDELIESSRHYHRFSVTVEPIIALYVVVTYLQTAVIGQYLYFRIGRDLNVTQGGSRAYFCNGSDPSSRDEKVKVDRVQTQFADTLIHIGVAAALCTLVSAPFFSVFSDRVGRRLLFLVPGTGLVLKSLCELVIIVLQSPLVLFIFTEGLYGLFGGFPFTVGLCFSYVADISSSRCRTRRLAVLVAVMGFWTLVVSISVGFWIREHGYLVPFSVSVCLSLLCVLYPFFLLAESPRMATLNEGRGLSLKAQVWTLVTVYGGRPRHQTLTLVLVLVMYNFFYVAETSTVGLATPFLLSFPLCLTSIEVGFFNVLNLVAMNLGVLISVLLLSRFFPELIILVLCHLSGIIYALQMALSSGPTSVYIAASSNLFSFSASQFVKGFLSKMVGPLEQGALFGGLALCESIGGAITKVIVVSFYKATFHIFHGMVFLLVCCLFLVALLLTTAAAFNNWRNKYRNEFKELS